MHVVNTKPWLPSYQHNTSHLYILITSLNLGGAEKIVTDQLWANHFSKYPVKITLIIIYNKDFEHSLPPNINIIRLNNNINNGHMLFQQIAYEKNILVCHLINDITSKYLFSLNLNLHIVIHNDQRGWPMSHDTLNHPQIVAITSVAKFVTQQLTEVVQNKPIYTIRHNIKEQQFKFNIQERIKKRNELNIKDNDIVIGMIGRICQQKNYFLALDILATLIKKNPNYKLIILGGFEPKFSNLYIQLLNRINTLNLHQNVLLPGFKTDPHNWLNIFDIGLNTSYFEGLSMATQEFMRNGLPMILSKVCGQPEIIDINNQLQFFELTTELDTPDTNLFHLYTNTNILSTEYKHKYDLYIQHVNNITSLIQNTPLITSRIIFSEEHSLETSLLCYGSHNTWNLLNNIYPFNINKEQIKPIFITSNLNAGGAQRSLINLLKEFKQDNIDIPLILLNQSNQTQYFNELIEAKIDYYLCHQSRDVFEISMNLFKYISDNNINRIIFWNVDAKMKLLISKFLSKFIDIIDVSPGDYILSEMDRENLFQKSIYYNSDEYFSNLHHFISKYDNTRYKQEYLTFLKNKFSIIPNGVYLEHELHNPSMKRTPFKLLVCGRITPSKHLDIIFLTFKNFLLKNPTESITLEVYGSVEPHFIEYYNCLNEQFKNLFDENKIIWKGHHDEPSKIMPNYHAIIVLGTHQGSPNVVLEAGSCRLPIISNDSGGTREIINENTGTLIPEIVSADLLYNALEQLYFNYDSALLKAENCLNHIKHNFSMKKMKDSYKEIIFE
jgi:glycosyltransferase involved in cell wall biosynthesis